jgi:transcriptional regulator with XRE-family HTH domain
MQQRCGLSQQMIGYVERGMRKPSLETAMRMADALGFNLEDAIKQARTTASKAEK